MDPWQWGNTPMQHQYMQNWTMQSNMQGNTFGSYQQDVCSYSPRAFVSQTQQLPPNNASSYPNPVQQQPTNNAMVNETASAPPPAQNGPQLRLSVIPFQVPILSNGSQNTSFPMRDRGPNQLRDAFYASPRAELRGSSRLELLEAGLQKFNDLRLLYQTEKRAHLANSRKLQDALGNAEIDIAKYSTELEDTKLSFRTLQQAYNKQARELEKAESKFKEQEGDMSRLQQSTGVKDRAEALKRLAAAVENHSPVPQSSSLKAIGYQHKAWNSPAIAQMVRDCYPRDCKCDEPHTRLQQQQAAAKSATPSRTPPDTAASAAGTKRPRDSSSEEKERAWPSKCFKKSPSATSPKSRQPTQAHKVAPKASPQSQSTSSPTILTGWNNVGASQMALPENRLEDGPVETWVEQTSHELSGQLAQQKTLENNDQVEQTLEQNLYDLAMAFNSAGDDLDNMFTEQEVAEMEDSLNSDEQEEVDAVQPPDDYTSELIIIDGKAPGQTYASATIDETNAAGTAAGWSSLERPDSQQTLREQPINLLPSWWSWQDCNAMAQELAAGNRSPSDDEDSDEEEDDNEEEEDAAGEYDNGQESQTSCISAYPSRQVREESEESEEL